ncbi:sugar phosphate isomerase/epimerase [Paenibacillus sp. J5C_2022]|uniref:sugar phosphate isomerase/epimerase family protein n=1 Tax=Paenibacillus sp. J5C2022 TaxID=2977129 RepID=UPI0021D297F6|nr:sugar phosphate isomerase/epimerase family protein [Paenibacillus sp. J5C2022]MCU6707773.1 sugar phosphate isomerase/epimerase [Paenibacillus sp. J5C2022]
MLKSVNQWCYPDHTPLEKVFQISADAGYEAVELNLYEPGGTGLTLDSTPEEVAAIGELAKRYGLQLRSLSTGLLWKSPLSSADAEVRAQGRSIVSKQLEIAEQLGMDTVLVVPGAVNADTPYDACYERSQGELRLLAEEAERRGVRIGVENVWNKFLLSPLEMARYVDEIGSSHIGVYFDVGNILLMGFPEQWIRILGDRIFKVHVKDFRPGVGTGQGFVPLLSGNVNWKAVREALEEIGYTDTLTAEVGFYESDPWQLAYDTAQHMEVILGRRDDR